MVSKSGISFENFGIFWFSAPHHSNRISISLKYDSRNFCAMHIFVFVFFMSLVWYIFLWLWLVVAFLIFTKVICFSSVWGSRVLTPLNVIPSFSLICLLIYDTSGSFWCALFLIWYSFSIFLFHVLSVEYSKIWSFGGSLVFLSVGLLYFIVLVVIFVLQLGLFMYCGAASSCRLSNSESSRILSIPRLDGPGYIPM